MGHWSTLLLSTALVGAPAASSVAQSVAAANIGSAVGAHAGQLPAWPVADAAFDGGPRARPASGRLPRQPSAGPPGIGAMGPARNGGGFGGEEIGFATYGGAVLPEDEGYPADAGPLPPPRVILGVGPRPCPPPPQIIRIGRGLTHPAHTRVVYGMPPPCGPR